MDNPYIKKINEFLPETIGGNLPINREKSKANGEV